MLKVNQINVFYGRIHALRDVSIEVMPGKVVSLIGNNGAGKSTLMYTLAGVLKSKTGSITYDGKPLEKEAFRVLGQGISLVPERRLLYANLTVKENLLMGAHLRRDKIGIKEDIEKMMNLFPIIRERLKQYAGTLSGGEQQMVAIARGLMSKPKLLMMDEPSLGLAPMVIELVFDTICELKKQGITILLAEQNALQTLEISDYAYVLETGHITLQGAGNELLNDTRVQAAYLGVAANTIETVSEGKKE